MKRPYIFIFLLVLLSCEAELDLSRVDGEQCIYLCTMIGNSPESKENLLYAIPCIPIAGEDIGALDAKVTLSGTAAHKSISFNKSKDSDFSSVPVYSLGFKQDLRPGDRIEVKASAKGYPSVKAETVVPEPIRIVSADIVEKEGSFITLEIVYEEDDDEDGYYGIMFNDHNISEAPGFTMAESFDMIIYNYHFVTEKNILIWDRHKVIKENGKVTFRTYIDTGGDYNEYDITLYRLSPETFLYLRGKHMTMSEFPSIGMSTPAFTYSNVAGGIGIVGSWWGTEMILKYTE